ncbi:N-formylglutamate amidohydrolase [Pararhizobium antarcticum]|uniref:N-formylglutamate amidohydrolase n=1 Tax=Pararhizobium antarcticum TaxID=1798805 RepID=A0A657M0B4_9HYPH|nr:N-formylglutamate amidohydrolase [Pararhizobium antarcticum]OJG00083.1 N-formylglutamate amidohydrolase [Rhizobium sp. 58]OJG01514.1 N-formylglutamate amidohydrolase [Pararhizobium antarcticum]
MSDQRDVEIFPASDDWWTTQRGASPVVATAIHNGHNVRADLLPLMALADAERLREEDPFTEFTIRDVRNRIVFHRSRFEVDLNRSRDGAVYLRPEQAWGLNVWRQAPAADLVEASLRVHDDYYTMLTSYLRGIERSYGRFVLLDIHSYNHHRDGPDALPTDSGAAPEINIGTSSIDRARWGVVDAFMEKLASFEFRGRRMDVRENIAFQGKGEQTRFIHDMFPKTGCAIAVEFKKFFMDEWTGAPDVEALEAMRAMIASTVPVLEDALAAMR